jgi:hypothetical protein
MSVAESDAALQCGYNIETLQTCIAYVYFSFAYWIGVRMDRTALAGDGSGSIQSLIDFIMKGCG